MDVSLRAATPADEDVIEILTLVSYFQVEGSRQDEHAAIAALRREGLLSLSLVAEHEGYVVGHLAASPLTLSDGSPGWYVIGPLAVGPGHRGQGIATALLQAALVELEGCRAAGCVAAVYERGAEGRLFTRLGFAPEPGLTVAGGGVLLARPFGDRMPPLAEAQPHPALRTD